LASGSTTQESSTFRPRRTITEFFLLPQGFKMALNYATKDAKRSLASKERIFDFKV